MKRQRQFASRREEAEYLKTSAAAFRARKPITAADWHEQQRQTSALVQPIAAELPLRERVPAVAARLAGALTSAFGQEQQERGGDKGNFDEWVARSRTPEEAAALAERLEQHAPGLAGEFHAARRDSAVSLHDAKAVAATNPKVQELLGKLPPTLRITAEAEAELSAAALNEEDPAYRLAAFAYSKGAESVERPADHPMSVAQLEELLDNMAEKPPLRPAVQGPEEMTLEQSEALLRQMGGEDQPRYENGPGGRVLVLDDEERAEAEASIGQMQAEIDAIDEQSQRRRDAPHAPGAPSFRGL